MLNFPNACADHDGDEYMRCAHCVLMMCTHDVYSWCVLINVRLSFFFFFFFALVQWLQAICHLVGQIGYLARSVVLTVKKWFVCLFCVTYCTATIIICCTWWQVLNSRLAIMRYTLFLLQSFSAITETWWLWVLLTDPTRVTQSSAF